MADGPTNNPPTAWLDSPVDRDFLPLFSRVSNLNVQRHPRHPDWANREETREKHGSCEKAQDLLDESLETLTFQGISVC